MNYKKIINKGLTARECYTLQKLATGDQSPTELADDLVSKVSITQIGDKLLANGYITRTPSPMDRRKLILSITKKGREAIS